MTGFLTTGSGSPVTVFAPGRGETIDRTRPFGSGVRGTRVFFEFQEPDPAESAEPTSGGLEPGELAYVSRAGQLSEVADQAAATRAFGASLGAACLAHLLARTPQRFERLVFALPAEPNLPYAALAQVRCPALVVGQEADPVHPVHLAERLAGALGNASLTVLPPGGLLRVHRARLRDLIAGFLNEKA